MPFVKGQQGDFPAIQMMNPQTQLGLYTRNAILRAVTGSKLDRMAIGVAEWLGFQEKNFLCQFTNGRWNPSEVVICSAQCGGCKIS